MLAALTDEQLNLRSAPTLRTIGEMTRHIIGARCRWFHDALGEGTAAVVSLSHWDRKGEPERTVKELVGGLETSWRELKNALDRWNRGRILGDGDGGISRPDIYAHARVDRMALIEHDVHHSGEISLALGMHGLKAPDL